MIQKSLLLPFLRTPAPSSHALLHEDMGLYIRVKVYTSAKADELITFAFPAGSSGSMPLSGSATP